MLPLKKVKNYHDWLLHEVFTSAAFQAPHKQMPMLSVGKNVQVFLMFSFLSKVDREKVFANVLDRKVAFQDYYKKKQNLPFSKGVSPSFSKI